MNVEPLTFKSLPSVASPEALTVPFILVSPVILTTLSLIVRLVPFRLVSVLLIVDVVSVILRLVPLMVVVGLAIVVEATASILTLSALISVVGPLTVTFVLPSILVVSPLTLIASPLIATLLVLVLPSHDTPTVVALTPYTVALSLDSKHTLSDTYVSLPLAVTLTLSPEISTLLPLIMALFVIFSPLQLTPNVVLFSP